jgi:hypothetical protein
MKLWICMTLGSLINWNDLKKCKTFWERLERSKIVKNVLGTSETFWERKKTF